MVRGALGPNLATKYETVVDAPKGPKHTSLYAEATYAIVDRLVLGAALERVLDQDDYNVLVQLEVPAFEILRLYASYQKIGFASLSDALPHWSSRSFEPNVVLTAQARLMLLPFLFLNGGLRQMYQWDSTYEQGSYRPGVDYIVTLEAGWEFN